MAAWRALPEAGRLAHLTAIARDLGPEFAAVVTPREARDIRFRSSGARIVHRPSQLAFCLVPGGTFRMGMGELEAAALEDLLDDNDLALLDDDLARMRPTRVVTVGPLLLAETPLPGDGAKPLRLEPHDVAAWLAAHSSPRAPFRLASEAEWEHAYRAGTTSPFPWGPWPPIAPPALPHPLGLAMMGFWREAVADAWGDDLGQHPDDGAARSGPSARLFATRGGGAERWPWTPMSAGWRPLLSAWRAEPRDVLAHDPRVRRSALRPAMALPAPRPEPTAPPDDAPAWTLAGETSQALMRLVSPLESEREAGTAALVHATRARLGPASGQGALALAYLLDLAQESFVPDRARLLELAARLVAASRASPIDCAAARAMREAVARRRARLEPLVRDPDPALGAAAQALLGGS
ncbi:MAG: hypothetical protein U1F43_23055 [Myxococcota bacterium]